RPAHPGGGNSPESAAAAGAPRRETRGIPLSRGRDRQPGGGVPAAGVGVASLRTMQRRAHRRKPDGSDGNGPGGGGGILGGSRGGPPRTLAARIRGLRYRLAPIARGFENLSGVRGRSGIPGGLDG